LVRKLDVEAAFLLGKLKEEIFIVLPEGLEEEKGKIGRLNSAIYGLAQAARVFFETVKKFLVDFMNFDVCISDSCIFIKPNIILGLYVDDILIIGENDAVNDFIVVFGDRFACRTDSKVDEFIGCQMTWNKAGNEVVLHQTRMINKLEVNIRHLIEEWKIKDCTTPFLSGTGMEKIKEEELEMGEDLQAIYRSTVGSLLYLTKHSRPDLSNSIRELSKCNKSGTRNHFVCLLRVCKWLFRNKMFGVRLKTGIM